MSLVYNKITSRKQFNGNIDTHGRQTWLMTRTFTVKVTETVETENLTLTAGIIFF